MSLSRVFYGIYYQIQTIDPMRGQKGYKMLVTIKDESPTEVGQYGITEDVVSSGELVYNDQYFTVRPLTVRFQDRAYQSNPDDTHGIYTESGSLYTTAKRI